MKRTEFEIETTARIKSFFLQNFQYLFDHISAKDVSLPVACWHLNLKLKKIEEKNLLTKVKQKNLISLEIFLAFTRHTCQS